MIGAALIAGGESGLLSRTTIYRTFNQTSPGEYVSGSFLNTTSEVAVTSPPASGGLIPAGDLSSVDSSNISSYALQYKSGPGGTIASDSIHGDYYYVVYSQSVPSTRVAASVLSSSTTVYGLLALAGFVCVIAGIALAVVGALRKGNAKKTESILRTSTMRNGRRASLDDALVEQPPLCQNPLPRDGPSFCSPLEQLTHLLREHRGVRRDVHSGARNSFLRSRPL